MPAGDGSPAEAFVTAGQGLQRCPAVHIDDDLFGTHAGLEDLDGHALLRDDEHVAALDDLFGILFEQLGQVRHAGLDLLLVRADEAGEIDLRIVDADGMAAADERLRRGHERAAAEIVRVRLEGETDEADAALAALFDELHKLLLVRVVRGLGVFEQREVDSLLAGKGPQRGDILRQAGAAKRRAGAHVVAGDVQPRVLADDIHDAEGVLVEVLGEAADLVGKADLQCVEVIAGVFDHLRAFPSQHGWRAPEEAHDLVARRRIAILRAHDGQRGLAEVRYGRAFTQELGAVEHLKAAVLQKVGKLLRDHLPRAAGQHRAAEDDDVFLTLLAQRRGNLLRDVRDVAEIEAAGGQRGRADADDADRGGGDGLRGIGGGA